MGQLMENYTTTPRFYSESSVMLIISLRKWTKNGVTSDEIRYFLFSPRRSLGKKKNTLSHPRSHHFRSHFLREIMSKPQIRTSSSKKDVVFRYFTSALLR